MLRKSGKFDISDRWGLSGLIQNVETTNVKSKTLFKFFKKLRTLSDKKTRNFLEFFENYSEFLKGDKSSMKIKLMHI